MLRTEPMMDEGGDLIGSDNGVTGTALPNELPPPPDLSHLPPQILHSGTVETLIGQNDDLMARLKVNIRRNSILEQKILGFEKTNSELSRANNALVAQQQIVEEKDIMLRERLSRAEGSQLGLKNEHEMLESQVSLLKRQNLDLGAYQRAMRRVRRWVVPLVASLKEKLQAEQKALLAKEAFMSDLRERLAQSVQFAQTLEARSSKDQAQLVEQYEGAHEKLKNEIEKLKADLKPLRDKSARIDQALKAEADSVNKIVFLERQNQEFQAQAEKFRKEAKTLAAEAITREKELTASQEVVRGAIEDRAKIEDQFESLQAVWTETQKRLEAAKLQHETLNRLNQELSRQLKVQRKSTENPEGGSDVNC